MSNFIEASERQRFIRAVEENCGNLEKKTDNERDSVILNWTKDLKRQHSSFKSVDRDKTAFALKLNRIMNDKVENKYTPNYNQVEGAPKVPTFKVPE